jgi:hypothetical protein
MVVEDYNNDGHLDFRIEDEDGLTKRIIFSALDENLRFEHDKMAVGTIDFTEDGVDEIIYFNDTTKEIDIYDSVQDIMKSYTLPLNSRNVEITTEYNFIGDMSNDLIVRGSFRSSYSSSSFVYDNIWILEGNSINSFVDNLYQWTDSFMARRSPFFNNIRDYDGDGYYSLGTFASGSPNGFIKDLRNTTDGYSNKIIFFDADGDGHNDRIMYDHRYDYYDQFQGTLVYSGLVEVVLSSTGEIWQYRGNINNMAGFGGIQTADINGDGLNDLFISHNTYQNKASLFYAPLTIPTDTQGNPRILTPQDADARIPSYFGGKYPSFSMEDFNNDGYDDIWVISNMSSSGPTTHALYHGAPN